MSEFKTSEHKRFTDLLEPVEGQLFVYCRSLTDNDKDAEDLYKDAAERCWKKFHTLREHKAFRAWFCRIASRLYFRRYLKPLQRVLVPIDDDARSLVTTFGEKEIEDRVDAQIIRNTLGKLNPKTRETIALFYFEDLAIEDIRRIQGGSLSGVKTRLERGRNELKNILMVERKIK